MTITISRITSKNAADINLPNESFRIYGRMIATFDGQQWAYTTTQLPADQVREMIFPDEHYDFAVLQADHWFVGAYDENDHCVGLAIYKQAWFKYLYLDDLKVNRAYREQGIGQQLLQAGREIAQENNYQGIYTIGQDNNLAACQFYLHSNFVIGGLNTREYFGTSQADKSNLYFYWDF
ncbi:GNAT family N-acetyltransferase [Lapidilactobacillus wuchangensis]|uniref:GNAT family N-acetyltransferase n=1 Tax=Lapidilactobacillus wuchangensis TaxID=2486001 RepID=UPI000F79BD4A|nr:GNAT family N-acetyltransferase [Lapidilactobacillus wuchangensis]